MIAIYILFYEKLAQTKKCIKSFLPSGVPVYILNNGSSAESYTALQQFAQKYKQIKLFDAGANLGVSKGRNYLINNTKEEWMFFVDNDIHVATRHWLQIISKHIEAGTVFDAFVPVLYNKHEFQYVKYQNLVVEGNSIAFRPTTANVINIFPGGAVVVRRQLFQRLALYDENLFIGYEDFEMSIRGQKIKAPIKAKLIDNVVLVHEHKPVKKRIDLESVKVRYSSVIHNKSSAYIEAKYDLQLNPNWAEWPDAQLASMTGKRLNYYLLRPLNFYYNVLAAKVSVVYNYFKNKFNSAIYRLQKITGKR